MLTEYCTSAPCVWQEQKIALIWVHRMEPDEKDEKICPMCETVYDEYYVNEYEGRNNELD